MPKRIKLSKAQFAQTTPPRFWDINGLGRLFRPVCAVFIASILCPWAMADEGFSSGLRAYNAGDYSTARRLWIRSAQSGDANAQASLAYLYYDGLGVRRDWRRAATWYKKAAAQGEPTAQSFLCEMHTIGDGVQFSLELALMWCELSINGGETRGVYFREQTLNQMTTQQRDEAWKMLAQWQQHPQNRDQLNAYDRSFEPSIGN